MRDWFTSHKVNYHFCPDDGVLNPYLILRWRVGVVLAKLWLHVHRAHFSGLSLGHLSGPLPGKHTPFGDAFARLLLFQDLPLTVARIHGLDQDLAYQRTLALDLLARLLVKDDFARSKNRQHFPNAQARTVTPVDGYRVFFPIQHLDGHEDIHRPLRRLPCKLRRHVGHQLVGFLALPVDGEISCSHFIGLDLQISLSMNSQSSYSKFLECGTDYSIFKRSPLRFHGGGLRCQVERR